MVEWKKTVRGDFFDIKLLPQPDVVFDSESNGYNFSSLAPPGGEKNDVTSNGGRFFPDFLAQMKV